MSEPQVSPRIDALRERVDAGDDGALEAFWRRAEAEGTPLVEAIAGDDAHRLVTFVFRADRPLRNVVVSPGVENQYFPASNEMAVLPGTNLWYRTYRARSDLRISYHLSPDDPLRPLAAMSLDEQAAYTAERARAWLTDPLNRDRFEFDPRTPAYSIAELPDAPPQRYVIRRSGVPEGTIERHDLDRDPFGEGRRIWTYLPPAYHPTRGPYPLLVLFDGWGSRKLGVHTTLDNMIADGVIPSTVCVMLHQLDRNIELPCNERFADWLATDFVPRWVRPRYAVTADPAQTVVSGMSYGGLGATWCAFRHPEVFGNVLSQSGSFWWRPEDQPHEWLTRQFDASPALPVRHYMDVGLLEDGATPGEGPSMVQANRHLRDVLRGKGNDVRYAEFNGGHDYVSWRGTIADGLAFLLGGRS